MKKRLLCLIISSMLALSLVNVATAENSDYEALSGLGIVCGFEYSDAKLSETIKKGGFINYALNIATDKKYTDYYDENALAQAEQMGLIVSAKDVKSADVLTKNEAITIMVRLLGYEARASELGGYPTGHMAVAAEAGLLKGVTLSDKVTYGEAFKLLFNATEADYSNYVITPGGEIITYENQINTLEYFKKVYTVEGVVSENGLTALYGNTTIGKGYVKIGDEVFEEGASGAGALIGSEVTAYVKDSKDGVDEILYAYNESLEDTVVIDGENVSKIEDNFTVLKFYRDKQSNKLLSEEIKSDAAFMKNGVAYSDFTEADFYDENAKIILVDNDSDGKYDFVNLEVFKTMVVSGTSISSQKIYNEFSFNPDMSELDLSKYKEENVFIYKNGEEIELSEIIAGDVLSIYETPKGEDGEIRIYAESNAFSGTLEKSFDSEAKAVINGTEYELSKLYRDAQSAGEACARALIPGIKYMFRLDNNGKIVTSETISGDDLVYGYATKFFYNDDNGTEIRFRMFLSDGSWQNIKLAKKVKHNGSRTLDIEDILTDADILSCIPGLIGIKLNADGEICVIETPVAYEEDVNPERLNTTGELSSTYRYNGTTFANQYYMTGSTVVFIVPSDEGAEETDYRIGNNYSFTTDASYTFTGYNRDKFYTLDMVVNKRDTSSIKTVANTVYMVKNMGIKATQDGDVLPFVNVASDTYAGVTLEGLEGVFDGVQKGDLIKIHVNNAGLIDNCEVVYSTIDGTEKVLPDSNGRNGNAALVKGFALDKDVAAGKLLVDTVEEMAFVVDSSKAVLVYDAENKEVSVGNLNDIERGNYVIVNLSKSAVSMVAVYKGL